MVKTLLVLLSHREETTREQTIMLLTTLFTWDVLGTLFQAGLNGLLLLSRKLSAEGVRKNANSGEGIPTLHCIVTLPLFLLGNVEIYLH